MKHETLAQALVGFQSEAPSITKNKTAKVRSEKGSYTYKYADLGDILSAIAPILASHGLAWTSRPVMTDTTDLPALEYSLVHETGERDEGLMPLGLPEKWTPQQFGSALTYARRYAMSAQLGLATDEDEDGAAASAKGPDALVSLASGQTIQVPAGGSPWHAKPQERPQARPVEQTFTPASAKQRGLINKHAGMQGLRAEDLANCVKKVMGQESSGWKDSIQAERWLGRALDRFPANKVDALLAEIDLQPSPLQRGQMSLEE